MKMIQVRESERIPSISKP